MSYLVHDDKNKSQKKHALKELLGREITAQWDN